MASAIESISKLYNWNDNDYSFLYAPLVGMFVTPFCVTDSDCTIIMFISLALGWLTLVV